MKDELSKEFMALKKAIYTAAEKFHEKTGLYPYGIQMHFSNPANGATGPGQWWASIQTANNAWDIPDSHK